MQTKAHDIKMMYPGWAKYIESCDSVLARKNLSATYDLMQDKRGKYHLSFVLDQTKVADDKRLLVAAVKDELFNSTRLTCACCGNFERNNILCLSCEVDERNSGVIFE